MTPEPSLTGVSQCDRNVAVVHVGAEIFNMPLIGILFDERGLPR